MKNERDWIPDATDLDWIESIAPPLPPCARGDRGRGRAARDPDRRSRCGPRAVDRSPPAGAGSSRSGPPTGSRRCGWRSASPTTARSSRSTRTASGPTSPAAGGARPASRTSASRSSTAKALDAFGSGEPCRLAGPFDLAFIDALKPEYEGYLDALIDGRLAPGALVPRRQRPVERPRRLGARPATADDANTARSARSASACSATRASRPRSCPSATACSPPRGAAEGTTLAMRIRVRLFAVQRELAGTREVALELADDGTVADAWDVPS